MKKKLIDYTLTLLFVVALFGVGWWLKEKSILITIVLSYLAVMILLIPFYRIKCVRWIVDLLRLPIALLQPIIRNMEILIITTVGIFFFMGCIDILVHLYEHIANDSINDSLTQYLSMTISFILATQKWYKTIIDKTANRYHSEFKSMGYQPQLAKFLIYSYYLITLVVSYTDTFYTTEVEVVSTTVLLASFATFAAYDRVVSNKHLLDDSGVSFLSKKQKMIKTTKN